ncbi:MAG: nucleotidyltransferase domain-containing protein [Candidatus Aenigmatarchaeota archaeon]
MEVIEVIKEIIEKRREAVKNAEKYLKEISSRAKNILKDAKVYVFGSYVKGNFHPFLSDIDVLIVSKEINDKNRAKIALEIEKDLPRIFEIHLVNEKEFEFYKFFIDKTVEI